MRGYGVLWIYLCVVCLSVRLVICEEPQEDADELKGTRPRSLAAEVLNSTTISLTWKHPKLVTDECPVKRYVLRLKQDGARRSRAWKVDGARKALGLHNLKPDTLYSIRLMAITCIGKGKPSKWVDIMTSNTRRDDRDKDARSPREEPVGIETRPPGRPTNVRTRTYPDSVILNWQEPTETEVVVRGYMVGYGEGVPDVNWQYVDANQRNLTIRKLKPSTQYIISLRAFNKIGKGPTVYDMIYTRELTAGPTIDPASIQQPEHVKAKVLSPTNIWLQWRDPSLDRAQIITDNRYYNVHYQSLPEGEKLSVVVKALHVVLYELTPGTEYEFTVRTVKDSFYSEFSEPIRNVTYETAPGSAPRSVIVSPINGSSAVQISWRPPKEPNGRIQGYLVLHSSDRVRPIAEWNAMATVETSATVDNLNSDTTYYFMVQARNTVGYGPLSKTSALQIHKDWQRQTYSEHLSINSEGETDGDEYDSDDDDDDNNAILETHAETDSDTLPVSSGNMSQNASDIVDPLDPNNVDTSLPSKNKRHDRYDVTEMPTGGSAAALSSRVGASKSEVQFAAKVLHTINAFITWPATPPRCNCEHQSSLIQYVFHLYMRGEEETPKMRHLRSNVVHLEDLDPNQRYHYQIKYIFPNGTETAWSQEQNLDTDCRGAGS